MTAKLFRDRSMGLAARSAICVATVLAACGSSTSVAPVASTPAISASPSSSTSTTSAATVSTAPQATSPSTSTTAVTRTTQPTTTSTAAFTPLRPMPPSSGGSPLNVVWSRSTVPAGPYNGHVRSDGTGLTSINSSTPTRVWVSDDGVTWRNQSLPAGFEATDASRSHDLLAVIGTTTSGSLRVPALAISLNSETWVVTVLDLGELGPAHDPLSSHVAVSGNRIIAAVGAGPEPGSDADTQLVFVGDSGAPFSRQVNRRFKGAIPSVGSQYIWWSLHESGPLGPVTTIFGPAAPIGNTDYTSLEAGWETFARLAGDVTHIGGRGAGDEYFAIDEGASPRSVRSIINRTTLVLDDAVAKQAFNGMNWLRNCCLNAEPSIGVGHTGIIALATTESLGRLPGPTLSKLSVATSGNGTDWTIEPIGQLLPEQGLDVTQLIGLPTRFLVVVTEREPQRDGTRDAIVLVGEVVKA
jgi:hypothetical protein